MTTSEFNGVNSNRYNKTYKMNIMISIVSALAAMVAAREIDNLGIYEFIERIIVYLAMLSISTLTCVALYNNKKIYLNISKFLNILLIVSTGVLCIGVFFDDHPLMVIAVGILYGSPGFINLKALKSIAQYNEFDFPIKDPTA